MTLSDGDGATIGSIPHRWSLTNNEYDDVACGEDAVTNIMY